MQCFLLVTVARNRACVTNSRPGRSGCGWAASRGRWWCWGWCGQPPCSSGPTRRSTSKCISAVAPLTAPACPGHRPSQPSLRNTRTRMKFTS
eukprot:1446606-Rhodomonas_salina.1